MNDIDLAKRSCYSKSRYATSDFADKIIRDRARHGMTLYKYECRWCKGFHLTRTPQ